MLALILGDQKSYGEASLNYEVDLNDRFTLSRRSG